MGKPLRVLLVEDSEFDATLLLRILRKGGYDLDAERVETADGVLRALHREWDLVIADYNLPGFSAPEALELVKKTGRDIPFIIVSGAIGETTAVAAMKAGAHDYLMKGNLTRLLPVIERELREAENREGKRVTKEALQESELRYRLLWETATDATILFDERGRIHFANPAVQEIFGHAPASLVGREVFALQPESIHWSSKGGLKRYLKSATPGRKWRARETIGVKRSGEEFPVEAAFSNIQIEGRFLFVVFFRDISERKAAEKELRENQEQFRVAREIQQHLFPKAPPDLPGYDIAGRSYPADATGGDYFDILPMLDDSVGLVVGDVTGHGVGPALLMAETRAYLRILAKSNPDPAVILTKANRVLVEDVGDERYVTLFMAQLHSAERRLSWVNAGHIPGYLLDERGEVVQVLKRTGVPLGLRPTTEYAPGPDLALQPGQTVLMHTDGFDEAVNSAEEMFGNERIFEVLRQHRHLPAAEMVETLRQAVKDFAGGAPQLDDLTAIIIKVK
jgi:sigma-B regulation protein RsbU (phosphoserine phosphatase)